MALGIATASIILFVGTGGTVMPAVVRAFAGYGLGPDKMLVNALLLNIALIIFGWRRYRQLAAEVEHRRKAEEEARLLAATDPLTGCLNRRSITEATNDMIAAACERGESIVLMMLDLDNFKHINDCNGHIVGDRILKKCADRIAALLPERSLLARLGGDEFAVVVAFDKSRPEIAERFAEAILEAVVQPIAVRDTELTASVSIGMARSDHGGVSENDAHTLLHMADIAMYHAKKQGRNRYYWFEEQMEAELRFRNEIESGIHPGIENGEFIPYYEQQIDIQTGELTGFEMLARWNSPKLGLISPEIFIPVAEEIGAIADLSESVIAQALEDAKTWRSDLTLSVNISPVQLRDPWFAQKLLKLLLQASFPPHRLEIEITESCLHDNVGMVRSLIASLKNQGIRVSLDDFGTGYSSLAQLSNLPFDRIKIDRSFVVNIAESKDSEAIVEAIARLGSGLGLPITAEGVQTSEVLDHLRRYGPIKAQGYHYGKPQPASATLEWLASRNLLKAQDADAESPSVDSPDEQAATPKTLTGQA